MDLLLSVEPGAAASTVNVGGDLDLGSAGQLEACLHRLVATGPPRLVVDVADVTFVDCTGLGVLLRAHRAAALRGGWLRLRAVPPQMSRVLHLTGAQVLAAPWPAPPPHARGRTPPVWPPPACRASRGTGDTRGRRDLP